MENYIKGNKSLAQAIGVSARTIQSWRLDGILDEATVSDFRRTIIYDLNKVFECLRNNSLKQGRKKN